MQNFGIRQISRTILTVVGIVLLIVFGIRAAGQASDYTAVHGRINQSSSPVSLSIHQLATIGGWPAEEYPANLLLTSDPIRGSMAFSRHGAGLTRAKSLKQSQLMPALKSNTVLALMQVSRSRQLFGNANQLLLEQHSSVDSHVLPAKTDVAAARF